MQATLFMRIIRLKQSKQVLVLIITEETSFDFD